MAEKTANSSRVWQEVKAAASDELRYAVSDIRQAWEQAWFGKAVTPSQMETAVTQSHDPLGRLMSPDDSEDGRAMVHGRNPDVPEAIEGIGHQGGEDFNPDHTRDAVRDFYGTKEPREPLDDLLSPASEHDDHDHTHRIDR